MDPVHILFFMHKIRLNSMENYFQNLELQLNSVFKFLKKWEMYENE